MNKKICQMVTDRIVAQLDKGVIPWRKPWTGSGGAISHSTGKPYSLLNQCMLASAGEYITFNQCAAEGGRVKKGATGTPVVFWKQNTYTDVDENGKEVERTVPTLRYYTVFHISDCEGIKAKYSVCTAPEFEPVDEAERVIEQYASTSGVKLRRGDISSQAYYAPTRDIVVVPAINQFENPAEYYSTTFHELTHSTGHPSRLGRFGVDSNIAAFGSTDYSKEELIAEIGAAALTNIVGLECDNSFENSTAYCQSWLKALSNDVQMMISACGKAQAAINLITGQE